MRRKRLFFGTLVTAAIAAGAAVLPAAPAMAAPPTNQWVVIMPTHSTNKCLDIVGGSTANGAQIQQFTCYRNVQQQFRLIPTALTGQYFLKPRHTWNIAPNGKCWDVQHNSSADGTKFQQWACQSVWQQHFYLAQFGSNWEIRGPGGKCADVTGASTSDGARLQLWTCLGGANQRFQIVVVG